MHNSRSPRLAHRWLVAMGILEVFGMGLDRLPFGARSCLRLGGHIPGRVANTLQMISRSLLSLCNSLSRLAPWC